MFQDYFLTIAQGIPTSLMLTLVSLAVAFFLAVGMTFILSSSNKLLKSAVKILLIFFTALFCFLQLAVASLQSKPFLGSPNHIYLCQNETVELVDHYTFRGRLTPQSPS